MKMNRFDPRCFERRGIFLKLLREVGRVEEVERAGSPADRRGGSARALQAGGKGGADTSQSGIPARSTRARTIVQRRD